MEDDEIPFEVSWRTRLKWRTESVLERWRRNRPLRRWRDYLHLGQALALLYVVIVIDLSAPGLVESVAMGLRQTFAEIAATISGLFLLIIRSIEVISARPMAQLVLAAWPLILVGAAIRIIVWYRRTEERNRAFVKRYQLLGVLATVGFGIWAMGSLFPMTTQRITLWLEAEPATGLLEEFGNWGLVAGAIIAVFLLIQFSRSHDERVEDEVARAWATLAVRPTTTEAINTGGKDALELLHRHGRAINGINVSQLILDGIDLSARGGRAPADLTGANFSNAQLNNATFTATNLRNAEFSGARATTIRLSESTLTGIIMKSVIFLDCTIGSAPINGGVFIHAKFDISTFSLRSIANCKFDGATFTKCFFMVSGANSSTFSNSKFNNSKLSMSIFNNCDFNGFKFLNKSIIETCTFENLCNFRGCNIMNSSLSDFSFIECTMEFAELSETCFRFGVIKKTSFRSSIFKNIKFSNIDMLDVDFESADITDTKFIDVKFGKNVKFNNAVLCGVDFSEIDRNDLPDFEGAYFDKLTRLPEDIRPHEVGMRPIDNHPLYNEQYSDREV